MTSPQKRFILILLIVLLGIFLNLPATISIDQKVLNLQIKQQLRRPPLDLTLGGLRLYNPLEFKFGLDLSGGTQILLNADMSGIDPADRASALTSLQEVISRRVDLFGVSEPSIRTLQSADQYQIIVELPGLSDPSSALTLLGNTAQLEFRTPVYSDIDPSGSPSATPQIVDFAATDLSGKDLKRAEVSFDPQTGQPVVSLQFNAEGTKKFAQLTKEYLNKPIAIFLDGAIITAPVVQTEILTGQAQITGGFTTSDAKTLSTQLNAGALPVSVKVVSQQNIAPTLGAESINRSVRAGLVGLLLVIAFIIIYYGRLGLISSFGLLIYGLITLTLYKLIPVTLTLPGIAGFILSVGMAVDSNILIFERYKEEIRADKPWTVALELAFGRAWDSIKDANITTLITAFILFNPLNWSFLPTSGPVRGFALTLALGIAISLFTGIYVTRTLLRMFYRPPKLLTKK